jgi:SIR2-like domain
MTHPVPVELFEAIEAGRLVPYLGPGVLTLAGEGPLPASADQLAARLTAKAVVPHKIRNNLTAAAQFIENFKHRTTVTGVMTESFGPQLPPSPLHLWLAGLPKLPLMVHVWYDDLPQQALARRTNWGVVQGVSQAEHFGVWHHFFQPDGARSAGADGWSTLLYQPLGSVRPAANFLISDSDFVEVLTEIDIQTPIPECVQQLRQGRSFLFLGCRFANQLDRTFARQVIKRSSNRHWAVLPEEPTKNEAKFLRDHNIQRIEAPLEAFATALMSDALSRAL